MLQSFMVIELVYYSCCKFERVCYAEAAMGCPAAKA